MKFQFSVRSMLLATAFAAVWLGVAIVFPKVLARTGPDPLTGREIAWVVGAVSPLWFPLVFVGYAFGRKSFNVAMLFAFAIFEAVAICLLALYVFVHSNLLTQP